MPETKKESLEREYIIPLRKEWQKVANYRRAGRAAKAIKKFIAKHMKVPDRDVDKVKIDIYLNQEIWFKGRTKPPARIKVKAVKEGDTVKVSLAEMPKEWQFAKQKHEKRHKKSEEKKEEKKEEKSEEKKVEEQKIEEEKKKEETEKEKAVAEERAAEAKIDAKVQKHLTKVKQPQIKRMALKK